MTHILLALACEGTALISAMLVRALMIKFMKMVQCKMIHKVKNQAENFLTTICLDFVMYVLACPKAVLNPYMKQAKSMH